MVGNYRVHWEIDVENEPTPEAAARYALNAILRPGSIAHVFDVHDRNGNHHPTQVDLDDGEDAEPTGHRDPLSE